jgi:hypothetical protein
MGTTIIGIHVKATFKSAEYFYVNLLNDALSTAMKWSIINYESDKKKLEILRETSLKF